MMLPSGRSAEWPGDKDTPFPSNLPIQSWACSALIGFFHFENNLAIRLCRFF